MVAATCKLLPLLLRSMLSHLWAEDDERPARSLRRSRLGARACAWVSRPESSEAMLCPEDWHPLPPSAEAASGAARASNRTPATSRSLASTPFAPVLPHNYCILFHTCSKSSSWCLSFSATTKLIVASPPSSPCGGAVLSPVSPSPLPSEKAASPAWLSEFSSHSPWGRKSPCAAHARSGCAQLDHLQHVNSRSLQSSLHERN